MRDAIGCVPFPTASDPSNICVFQAAVQAGLPYTDVQLPMLMRALYGSRSPKFVLLLRNPVDRIYSAYFGCGSRLRWVGGSQAFSERHPDDLVSSV